MTNTQQTDIGLSDEQIAYLRSLPSKRDKYANSWAEEEIRRGAGLIRCETNFHTGNWRYVRTAAADTLLATITRIQSENQEIRERQRAEDQAAWLNAFLPLLPENKREQYREQIRVAQAAAWTSEDS